MPKTPPTEPTPEEKELALRLANVEGTFEELRDLISQYENLAELSARLKRSDMEIALNEMNQVIINYLTEMRADA